MGEQCPPEDTGKVTDQSGTGRCSALCSEGQCWIGHTVLLQMPGVASLTDPLAKGSWSE